MKVYNYVYKITNKDNKKQYIGSRSSELSPEKDLGIVYFSSSKNKHFMKEQKEYPENFKYEILETFDDYKDAHKHEMMLLKTLDVRNDPIYYNGRIINKFDNSPTAKITKHTIEYLAKLIKLSRKEQGITESEMAERACISRATYQKIEKGNTKVQIGIVFECCFILKIPLLGGDAEHINNLSTMLSYMNNFMPKCVKNSFTVKDDF